MNHILFIGKDQRFVYAKKKLEKLRFEFDENPTFDHIVLPMKGADSSTLSEYLIISNPYAKYYVNNETEYFRKMKENYKLNCIYINYDDNFSSVNNRATAEAILAKIINGTNKNIDELRVMILGFGSSAMALVDILGKLSAKLIVVARREEVREAISSLGHIAIPFTDIEINLPDVDVIINTVPSLVVSDELLHIINPTVLMLDLATAPGGINHELAKSLGLNAFLLPGLPGIYAPLSSGEALAMVIYNEGSIT